MQQTWKNDRKKDAAGAGTLPILRKKNSFRVSLKFRKFESINPKLRTYLGRTKMASGGIDPRRHKFWLSVEFLKVYEQKTKAFDSIHRGKMEQILLAYGLPKETVAAIMMLYRNTKVKVRSPDGNTDYFDIVTGVQQGETLAPYLFIILRTSIDKIKENGFNLTKKRSRR